MEQGWYAANVQRGAKTNPMYSSRSAHMYCKKTKPTKRRALFYLLWNASYLQVSTTFTAMRLFCLRAASIWSAETPLPFLGSRTSGLSEP